MVVGGGQAEVRTLRASVLSAQRAHRCPPSTAPPQCPGSGAALCLPACVPPPGGNAGVPKGTIPPSRVTRAAEQSRYLTDPVSQKRYAIAPLPWGIRPRLHPRSDYPPTTGHNAWLVDAHVAHRQFRAGRYGSSIERPQPLLEDAHVVGPPTLPDDDARSLRNSPQLLDLGAGGVQLGTLSLHITENPTRSLRHRVIRAHRPPCGQCEQKSSGVQPLRLLRPDARPRHTPVRHGQDPSGSHCVPITPGRGGRDRRGPAPVCSPCVPALLPRPRSR